MPNLITSAFARGLVLAAAPLLAAFTPPSRESPTLGAADFADPFVLRDVRDEAAYYAFATGVGATHLQVARSSDLASWQPLGEALPSLPSWATQGYGLTWAPSVLARGGKYVLYFTTRDAASGFQCISRATAVSPEGPYRDESTAPLVCQTSKSAPMCGSIDPSPFVDADGTPYLVWKSDENSAACRTPTRLWSQRLRDDGMDVVGKPAALIKADRRWEAQLIEGPAMWHHGSAYYLFYSANGYESARYAVGYATCAGPLGPCEKKTTNAPLLASSDAALGPGGEELFADSSGATWMAYHAWSSPNVTYAAGGARSLRIAPVSFDETGPRVGPMH